MRVLFEMTHPHNVHMFRHAVRALMESGHAVKITAREKDGVSELLDEFGLEYQVLSKQGRGILGLALELMVRDCRLYRAARRFKPDVMVGENAVFAAQVSWMLGIPSIVFDDMEKQALSHLLTNRFATVLLTPSTYTKGLGAKQIYYDGCAHTFHLHPDRFTPDPGVLEEAGIERGKPFFLLRMVGWMAHHDLGQTGLGSGALHRLVELLERHGRVFITSEKPLVGELEKYGLPVARSGIHHLMYYASLFVGESTTMGAEAAILGTPAVVCNTLDHGFIQEFQDKYGLVFRFRQPQEAIARVEELLAGELDETPWQERRQKLVSEKVDGTRLLLDILKIVEDGCREPEELRRRIRALPSLTAPRA